MARPLERAVLEKVFLPRPHASERYIEKLVDSVELDETSESTLDTRLKGRDI